MARITFRFVDRNGTDITGTETVTGYAFRDFFAPGAADADGTPATVRAALTSAYRGRDCDGVGVEWEVE